MNYYPFHLGDYAAHTAHLELMEDLAYRRMLDAYYLRECPLPVSPAEVARLIRMRNNVGEVEAVLHEFFVLADEGWRHARCDEEIGRMQDKQAKARASAAASITARQANAQRTLSERSANAQRTPSGRSTDAELPTPTPTPTPKKMDSGPAQSAEPPSPPPPFDGSNADVLNGKAVVPIASSFDLPESWGMDAEALGFKPSEVIREAEKFRQFWTVGKGSGTRRSVKGWRQSWSNWLAKAAESRR